jgi:hypothetical protein
MAIDLKNNKNDSENVHILSLEIQWNWPEFKRRTDLFSFYVCEVPVSTFSVLPSPYIAWKQHPVEPKTPNKSIHSNSGHCADNGQMEFMFFKMRNIKLLMPGFWYFCWK